MRFLAGLFLAFVALFATVSASAETRIALIIGNGSYADPHWPTLANPVNDANAMQRALKDAGFETITLLNAKRRDFYRAVEDFSEKIARDPNAVGLFYYAGHGVQADGVNYLIPVDAEIETGADLDANAYDAGKVLRAMKAAQNQMNLVILDACRDNPLPKVRGATRGLARMDAPSGTFIAYAAAPGQEARDGASGTNGVFTGELVKAIAEPGVPLEQMFKKVITGVRADTHGEQEPWSEASIQGEFYFHVTVTPGASAAVPSAAPPAAGVDERQVELAFWQSIQNSTDPADFQDYLMRYKSGAFASLAKRRVTALQKAAAPAAPLDRPVSPALAAPFDLTALTQQQRQLKLLFGARPDQTFDTNYKYSELPLAGEYKSDEVRYLWLSINRLPAWKTFFEPNGCMTDASYVVWLYKNEQLFRVSVRLYASGGCTFTTALKLLESLKPGAGITQSMHTDGPWSVYEMIRPGVAHTDGDRFPF